MPRDQGFHGLQRGHSPATSPKYPNGNPVRLTKWSSPFSPIGLPAWSLMETRVTPMATFSDRKQAVRGLLENFRKKGVPI